MKNDHKWELVSMFWAWLVLSVKASGMRWFELIYSKDNHIASTSIYAKCDTKMHYVV